MTTQIVVISDVHIGTNYPTCWYQKDVHEPYLMKVLDWIIDNSANVQELVILGDLFDFWTYPPDMTLPTIDMILQANPNIFGPDGKLSQVLTALNGNVTYLCGNHDMNVTQADLNKIPNPHYQVKKADDVYTLRTGWSTTFTHGHLTTLFCAPDIFNTRFGGLPLGHFVTRAVAYMIKNSLQPGQTAADLPNQGSPYGIDISSFLSTHVDPFDPSITETFLNYIIDRTKIPRNTTVQLANGQSITIGDATAYYRNLWSQWVDKYGAIATYKAAWADYDGSYMGWFAQKRAFETNTDLVVMGHTHVPKQGLPQGSLASYINSGFECVSKPDFGKQAFTFAVLTQVVNPPTYTGPPTSQLYQVVKNGGSYTIEPYTAGPDWIASPNTAGDYSCYVQVDNLTGVELKLLNYRASQGNYVVPPPASLSSVYSRFWLQDVLGPHGSKGTVTYEIQGGPRSGSQVTLTFEDPYSFIYPNSCSGAHFRTKSGAGNWGADDVIVKDGHPFYIQFYIN